VEDKELEAELKDIQAMLKFIPVGWIINYEDLKEIWK